MPIPAAAPVLRPLEEVVDVLAAAVAVEEADDEPDNAMLVVLAAADVLVELELEVVEVL